MVNHVKRSIMYLDGIVLFLDYVDRIWNNNWEMWIRLRGLGILVETLDFFYYLHFFIWSWGIWNVKLIKTIHAKPKCLQGIKFLMSS